MSEDGRDAGLVAMISSILGGGKRTETVEPPVLAEVPPSAPSNGAEAPLVPTPPEPSSTHQDESDAATDSVKPIEAPAHVTAQPDGKRRLPAEAIAELVLGELRKIESFPASGASVTVYGYRHWNAMITFAPFSTTFQNATRFRQALPDLVFKLRRFVELEI
ncbi:hypothetical protein [Bradyrhizobium sp.]|uniref:hypothetical protein n=1 Tax=Bradyrhizobium sp. TaxID=376 RepID=UPI0039E55534